MQFSALFITTALPFLILASPAQRRHDSFTKLAVSQNEKRSGEPSGCDFTGKFGNSFINDPTGDGESCFGYDNDDLTHGLSCDGPFDQEEIDNIKTAVREQVTKDGYFKTSEAGEWTAVFGSYTEVTSAFKDRDTSAFDTTLDAVNVQGNPGAGQTAYYWQRKGDYLAVKRAGCP